MKKLIIGNRISLFLSALVLVVLAVPLFASAQKATIINDAGSKKVITIGDKIPKGYHLFAPNVKVGNVPTQIFLKRDLVGSNTTPYNFASTTAYLPYWIATSTAYTQGDYGFDTLSLNIKVINASTTAANTISITPTYSNDDGCGAGGATINWFTSADSASNQTATSVTATANTTTYYKYSIKNLATLCTKLVTSASFASSTIYIQGLYK